MNPIIIALIIFIIIAALFGEKLMMKANSIIWSKEKPEKIIGTKVRLGDLDCLGANPPGMIVGNIKSFEKEVYHIDFDEPVIIDDQKENFATVSARHLGHPVSRLSKRGILAVGGKLESGRGFISLIAKKEA